MESASYLSLLLSLPYFVLSTCLSVFNLSKIFHADLKIGTNNQHDKRYPTKENHLLTFLSVPLVLCAFVSIDKNV